MTNFKDNFLCSRKCTWNWLYVPKTRDERKVEHYCIHYTTTPNCDKKYHHAGDRVIIVDIILLPKNIFVSPR